MTREEKIKDLQERIDNLRKINKDDVTKPEIIRKNRVWIQIYKEKINSIRNEE